ncbi:MAG: DUF4105 domain-containing protein [Candidatus Eisenbacteria bacterium]|nr:DUF4105 domain-containing protein [Candidatus Eisenbacteria bacterium]
MTRSVAPWMLFLCVLTLAPTVAAGQPPSSDGRLATDRVVAYVDTLIERAREMELWNDPYWRTLLHYERGLFGTRSLVDDPSFFASPVGKKDPRAELEATLRILFDPPLTAEEPESLEAIATEGATSDQPASRDASETSATGTTDASVDPTEDTTPNAARAKLPICRFVARYEWLKEQLDIDESRVPDARCEPFEELYTAVGADAVSLIFPTSHMNSPASMYGHTLLTIGAASETSLLSHAINYSAVTNETFGPLYIAKGLLGLYPGYFSMLPYYAKLQEYSDVNDRDIWEYPLAFEREEIRRLFLHLYELENINSNYYFFSQNCSYHLLYLLEAARPGLDLTNRFGWWVIPLDTIRAAEDVGLVRDPIYRPSKSTKVSFLAGLSTHEEQRLARDLALGKTSTDEPRLGDGGLAPEARIRVLDLAGEYLQYIYAKGEVEQEAYVPRFLATLRARSSLGVSGEWRYAIQPPTPPDHGHRSARIELGSVFVRRGPGDDGPLDAFPLLTVRPAYHDLLDNAAGFKRGSQIIFAETGLRYDPRREKLRVEFFDAIDIVSLAPRDLFFHHTSWRVKTGLIRRTDSVGGDPLVFHLGTGFGWSFGIPRLGVPYLMVDTETQIGGGLDSNYAIGGGASAGILGKVTNWWQFHLSGRAIFFRLGDRDDLYELEAGQSLIVSTNTSLTATVRRLTERDQSHMETRVSARIHY